MALKRDSDVHFFWCFHANSVFFHTTSKIIKADCYTGPGSILRKVHQKVKQAELLPHLTSEPLQTREFKRPTSSFKHTAPQLPDVFHEVTKNHNKTQA